MNKLTATQLAAIIAELENGCAYKTACSRVRVAVGTLREDRFGDPTVGARCSEARAVGLVKRAGWLRERAKKFEAQAVTLRSDARAQRERHRRYVGMSVADYDEVYG